MVCPGFGFHRSTEGKKGSFILCRRIDPSASRSASTLSAARLIVCPPTRVCCAPARFNAPVICSYFGFDMYGITWYGILCCAAPLHIISGSAHFWNDTLDQVPYLLCMKRVYNGKMFVGLLFSSQQTKSHCRLADKPLVMCSSTERFETNVFLFF